MINQQANSPTRKKLSTLPSVSGAIVGDGLGGLGWLFGADDNPWKWIGTAANPYPILYWQ